jgi:hypothetical protein
VDPSHLSYPKDICSNEGRSPSGRISMMGDPDIVRLIRSIDLLEDFFQDIGQMSNYLGDVVTGGIIGLCGEIECPPLSNFFFLEPTTKYHLDCVFDGFHYFRFIGGNMNLEELQGGIFLVGRRSPDCKHRKVLKSWGGRFLWL